MAPPVLLESDVVNWITHMCRCMSVTLISFVTAVNIIALAKLTLGGGLRRNTSTITSLHSVNCRRLMKKAFIPYLGFHGIGTNLRMVTPHSAKDHFRERIKYFDTDFCTKINEMWMIEERTVVCMLRPKS